MYISEELENIFKKKNIKNIIIFSSALLNQAETVICTIRNLSHANIDIFFRDEDIDNLNLESLHNIPGVKYSSYKLDIASFLNIKRINPQLSLILCDNPYNIGYRKAKTLSILARPDIILFSNILNEVKYLNLKEFYKNRSRFVKILFKVSIDSVIAPLFYIAFISYTKLNSKINLRKRFRSSNEKG